MLNKADIMKKQMFVALRLEKELYEFLESKINSDFKSMSAVIREFIVQKYKLEKNNENNKKVGK